MSNGNLPASSLAAIPGTSPRGHPLLVREAAAAYAALHAESMKRWRISMAISEDSIRRTYRELSAQRAARAMWCARGNCGNAAVPGTSNHGWGLCVDVMTRQQRWVMDQIGAKYGFSKRWSDAPWEWWHVKYEAGHWHAPPKDPIWFLDHEERTVVTEYLRLKHANANRARRGHLFRWMIARRKAIYHAASGGHGGWSKYHRRQRYAYFYALTRG